MALHRSPELIPANFLEFQRVRLPTKPQFIGFSATFMCESFSGKKLRVRLFFIYIEIVS